MTRKQLEKRTKMVVEGFLKKGISIVNNKATLPSIPLFMGNGASVAYLRNNKVYAMHFGYEQPPEAQKLEADGYTAKKCSISGFTVKF